MKSVMKNFIYNTGYQILAILIPLITTPYLSRIIGAYGIGKYSYAYSIAYYFVIFIMLGINNYGNRSVAAVRDDKEKLSNLFWELYSMQFFLGVIVTGIYAVFCFLSYRNNLIQLSMLVYVLSAIFDINWFFWGMEKFKLTTVRNAFIKIVCTALIFILVKEKEDLLIYVFISIMGTFLGNIILWPSALKIVGSPRIRFKTCVKHIYPNLILFIPIIAVSLYKVMDKVMLGKLTNMEEVGYYEYSEKITQIPMAIVNSLAVVMLPRVSNLVANENSKSEKKYMSLSIMLVMFLSTSLCFGIMAIAKEFVPFFYGSGYDSCVKLFYILLPSCCFVAFSSVIRTQYLIPHKDDKTYIISVFVGAIINLLLNALLIPKVEAIGAALATLIAEFFVFAYQSISVIRKLDILQYLKNSLSFIIAGICMFCTVINVQISSNNYLKCMLIKTCIGICSYFIYLLIFIQFNKEEKKTVRNIISRIIKR